MNVFFYSASVSKYTEPYFNALQGCMGVKDLYQLPSGCGLTSPPCLDIRSGDILILYVENGCDVDSLLAMASDLDDYRILLLCHSGLSQKEREAAYQLRPIFTATPSEFTKISAVIMNILLRNNEQQWGAPA